MRGWPRSEILRLNVGLSNTSGVLAFYDPGHEGGMLQGSVVMDLPDMSAEDLESMTSRTTVLMTHAKQMLPRTQWISWSNHLNHL